MPEFTLFLYIIMLINKKTVQSQNMGTCNCNFFRKKRHSNRYDENDFESKHLKLVYRHQTPLALYGYLNERTFKERERERERTRAVTLIL